MTILGIAVMAKTYNDPVKQLSRDKLRDFIKSNLSFKDYQNMRVVCFPGAENVGEEAIEVKEVYDALGIPRKNITGIEYDSEKAERLHAANLGITVVNSTALDYFKTAEGKFDIISLDYTGHQGQDELAVLEEIAGKQLLTKYGILATNYSAKRESNKTKQREFHNFTRAVAEGFIKHELCDVIRSANDRLSLLEAYANGTIDIKLSDIRDSITYEINRIFGMGIFNKKFECELFKANPDYDKINEEIRDGLKIILGDETLVEKIKHLISIGVFDDDYIESIKNGVVNTNAYITYQKNGFTEFLSRAFDVPADLASQFSIHLHKSEAKSYFIDNIERYSYNSNKNMLMYMDLIKFKRPERFFDDFEDIFMVDYTKNPPFLTFNRQHMSNKKLLKKAMKWGEEIDKIYSLKIPKRIYLGSSFKPPKRMERISKANAISLLKSGCSPEEICGCYSGFTKMQLAAFKAHITMGTYENSQSGKAL